MSVNLNYVELNFKVFLEYPSAIIREIIQIFDNFDEYIMHNAVEVSCVTRAVYYYIINKAFRIY